MKKMVDLYRLIRKFTIQISGFPWLREFQLAGGRPKQSASRPGGNRKFPSGPVYAALMAFSFSASAGTDYLWKALEGSIDKETFQFYLAQTIVSEQRSVKERTTAVLKLAETMSRALQNSPGPAETTNHASQNSPGPAKGWFQVPEEIGMALIDTVRLTNTPYRVRHAIQFHTHPIIRDEANQMEILNWILSKKGRMRWSRTDFEGFIQRTLTRFPNPSHQVKRKIIELALHPKTYAVMFNAAVEHIQTKGFYDFENGGGQMFYEDLQSFHTAGKIHQAAPAMERAMGYIYHPSAEVLLNLAKLIVHPNPDFLTFRRPALDILDKHTESLDAEVQKELFRALAEGFVGEGTAKRIALIFSRIPQVDPAVKSMMISALNNPEPRKPATAINRYTNLPKSVKNFLKRWDMRDSFVSISYLLGVTVLLIHNDSKNDHFLKWDDLSVGMFFGITTAVSTFFIAVKNTKKCNDAFKDRDPDEGY